MILFKKLQEQPEIKNLIYTLVAAILFLSAFTIYFAWDARNAKEYTEAIAPSCYAWGEFNAAAENQDLEFLLPYLEALGEPEADLIAYHASWEDLVGIITSRETYEWVSGTEYGYAESGSLKSYEEYVASVEEILFNYREGLEEFCFNPVEAGDAVKGIY